MTTEFKKLLEQCETTCAGAHRLLTRLEQFKYLTHTTVRNWAWGGVKTPKIVIALFSKRVKSTDKTFGEENAANTDEISDET